MKSKKAQGISINTVVIVVLALIVLAILAFVVFNTSDSFDQSSACYQEGGRCVAQGTCETVVLPDGQEQCGTGQQCCRIG